jgi:molybdate transport system substrate-binding protein
MNAPVDDNRIRWRRAIAPPLISTVLLSNFSVSLSRLSAQDLLVATASDLAPAKNALETGFRKTGGGVTVTLGSSGMLAAQVRQGAPYDVYLSANERFVRELEESGHVLADSVRVYANGRLGLWSRDGSIRSVAELAGSRVRHVAIANPRHAPYGMAAKEALGDQGLWDKVKPKVVFGENVRQAFEFADGGNAEAVITSWTLVHDKGGILLPEAWHQPIRQAGGIVRASRRQEAARRFLDFLAGPEGRRILRRYGLFEP